MTNKGKKKYWYCKWNNRGRDAYGEFYSVCENPKSGCGECRCDDIFKKNACPFFERGETGIFLKMSKGDKESLAEFKKEMDTMMKLKEASERELLKYLKEKYE